MADAAGIERVSGRDYPDQTTEMIAWKITTRSMVCCPEAAE
ncbi:hypothetical protein ASZ90_010236 [hydrocarbon metagenome]|uniref:Uncharacterized protein n=1 Tax=hydrocarbon metagenome TaxID=938273 RepID=A0A0W8FHB5_9ZZZZ